TIVEWNEAAARITGLPADRVLGKTCWTAFPTARGAQAERVLQDVLVDGQPRSYLAPVHAPDFKGTFFETQASRGPRNRLILAFREVRPELSRESGAIVAAFDEERRLYARLFKILPIPALVLSVDGQILEANAEGGSLLGAADVRSLRGRPLADWVPAAQRSPLAAALREALRAGRVVQTLLDFARQRPRMRGPVDIKDIVARVIALHRSALKKARVQAVDSMTSDVPAVIGDPQELQQVFLNALVNAEQAIASTGRPGKVIFSSRRTEGRLVILVEDTGPGVPREILDRVFEPFFTTKGELGRGLGLAISYGLVKGMGGRMDMMNVEGGGAALAIELPVDAAPPEPAPEVGAPQTSRSLSVLVVEDEDSVRRGIARMAECLGHRTTT